MKTQIISPNGEGLGLAWALKNQGHEVWITHSHDRNIAFKGVCDISAFVKDTDAIVVDQPGTLIDDDQAYGCGAMNDTLHHDIPFGVKITKSMGLTTAPTMAFKTIGELINYTETMTSRARFIDLTSGVPYHCDARNGHELSCMVRGFQGSSMLVQAIPDGPEISIGGFFHHGELDTSTLFSSVDTTKDGKQSCVSWFWKKPTCKLFRQLMQPLLELFEQYEFDGPLSIKAVINEKSMRPVFTGFDTGWNFLALHGLMMTMTSPVESLFMKDIPLETTNEFCGTVRVSTPAIQGKPVTFLNPIDNGWEPKIFFPLDLYKEKDQWWTAGNDGAVCDLTAHSPSLETLSKHLSELGQYAIVPDRRYNEEPVNIERLQILRDWKYIKFSHNDT